MTNNMSIRNIIGLVIILVFAMLTNGEAFAEENNKKLLETFLAELQQDQVPVSIFLVNGIKLQGKINGFNDEVIMLQNTVKQMVYQHAISTIVPAKQ